MEEAGILRQHRDGVVADIQVPQFGQSEQGRRQSLQLIVGEVERLQGLDLPDGGREGDYFVVLQALVYNLYISKG